MTPFVGTDIALWSTYLFIAFFVVLVLWLHRESKVEGYPLTPDAHDRRRIKIVGYPAPPPPRSFHLAGGETVTVRDGRPDTRDLAMMQPQLYPGTPFVPTGNPMADGVGPAAWAERADKPDVTFHGDPRIVPLRIDGGWHIATDDPNPIGMTVVGGDGKVAGTISDAWVDRSEYLLRYYEVTLADGGRTVLLPVPFTVIDGDRRTATVKSIFAAHFAGVPATKSPDQITRLEEDKISGYYGGGTLYASRSRSEPLI
jgi:photosynthetic reaction center H subunit